MHRREKESIRPSRRSTDQLVSTRAKSFVNEKYQRARWRMPREPFERPPRKTERVAIATVAPHACQDACTQTARVFLLPRVGKPRACTRAHKQERRMTRRHKKPTRDPGMRVRTDARTAAARVAEESLGRSMPLDGAELSRGGAPRAVRARDIREPRKRLVPSTPSSSFDDESCLGASEEASCRNIGAVFSTRATSAPALFKAHKAERNHTGALARCERRRLRRRTPTSVRDDGTCPHADRARAIPPAKPFFFS